MSTADLPILPRDLFLLDPKVVFLNHGSFGATARPVFETYQYWQRELERQPVEFLARRFTGLMREARTSLAAYVGTSAANLVFVTNATTGINIVARSLALRRGDEVLITDHEYGAIERTWKFLCRKTGAILKTQPIRLPITTAADCVDQFWAGVTPRTRVICLSHITSPTALIIPAADICRRARETEIISIVDGAHALGQIPLDMPAIGADFYSANAHKWLCTPKGSGFLYARPEMQHLLEPLVVSWGYESLIPSASKFIDEQEWAGTRDIAAWLAVPEAIKFFEEYNWQTVRARCHELVRQARSKLEHITGLHSICPDSVEWFSQMASMPLPTCDTKKLQAALYDQFHIEIPAIEWQGRQFLRISIQAYNSAHDVERLAEALNILLKSA